MQNRWLYKGPHVGLNNRCSIMAKILQRVLIWGFISIISLKFWTYVRKRQEQNKLGDILEWQSKEVTKLHEVLKTKQVLNKRQCENLLNKLDRVVYHFNGMITSTNETSNIGLVLEELCRIIQRVRVLVEDCGKQEWCHAAAFQMNNREAFRELVYDLKCFWDAICEIYSLWCVESQYDIPSLILMWPLMTKFKVMKKTWKNGF